MAELIINCVNVFLLFFAAGYLLSGMVSGKLNQRKAKIAERIESAKNHREEALLSREEYEHRIKDFETERQGIMTKAQERAKMTEGYILKEAGEEAASIVGRAEREAELRKAKVKDDVKMDIIHVSERLAEKLIKESVDSKSQDTWIADMLEEMGEKTWESL